MIPRGKSYRVPTFFLHNPVRWSSLLVKGLIRANIRRFSVWIFPSWWIHEVTEIVSSGLEDKKGEGQNSGLMENIKSRLDSTYERKRRNRLAVRPTSSACQSETLCDNAVAVGFKPAGCSSRYWEGFLDPSKRWSLIDRNESVFWRLLSYHSERH